MHPIGKIIIGLILMIASVWAVSQYNFLDEFLTVVKGVVPAAVFLIGLFIVWLELDELRIEKELKTEKRTVTKRIRKRKR